MKLTIEVRPGEGGEDARGLVAIQGDIYEQFLANQGIAVSKHQDHG